MSLAAIAFGVGTGLGVFAGWAMCCTFYHAVIREHHEARVRAEARAAGLEREAARHDERLMRERVRRKNAERMLCRVSGLEDRP